jgi:membrane protein required for colicin V production
MGNTLNSVDVFLLICFVPAIIGGIMSGLVRQVASLVALILGAWAGWHFSALLAEGIKIWFKSDSELIGIISFALIFIAVVIVVNLIGKALSGIIKFVMLGWLDRLLGVIFAILKYAFIFSVAIYLLNSLDALYPFLPKHIIKQSALYPLLESMAPSLFPYLQKIHLF